MAEHYDVIIVGSGAGGGTLAHTLAPSGKKILLLERGDFLPREMGNWDPSAVFVDGRYLSPDTWYDPAGRPFQPQVHYFVGGATKLYGAALYRLRPADFGEIRFSDGVSPAWPLDYSDLEPFYTKAEWLYQVHGDHGEDPTEGPVSRQYPHPPASHQPPQHRSPPDPASTATRPVPLRPGKGLGPGGAELHVPQQQGGRRVRRGAQRDGLPEDPGHQRLLPGRFG